MSPSPEEKTEHRIEVPESYPCLEVIAGPKHAGIRFPLKQGKNTIGRSQNHDVVLDDSSVSRHHANIEITPAGAVLTDQGSRNGTKAGGQKITGPYSLAHNTRLRVGVYQLRYLTQNAEAAVPEEDPLPETVMEVPPQNPSEVNTGLLPEEGEIKKEKPVKKEAPKKTRWKGLILFSVVAVGLAVGFVWGWPHIMQIIQPTENAENQQKSAAIHSDSVLSTENHQASSETQPAVTATTQPITSPTTQPVFTETQPVVTRTEPVVAGPQPVFLDFSATPISGFVYFGDQQIGATPLRISTNLEVGRYYEIRALFQLPEVGEVLEEKNQFTFHQGDNLIPIQFAPKVGVFKVTSLPRDAQLYLEAYFERDPYRAKPIKFSEVVFGKPVYVPFGRYVLEIRKSRQLGNSQTFLDEVVYRREFTMGQSQTTYTVDINDEALNQFPVQITSVPAASKVLIDDKEVGTTPFTGVFPVGDHLLTVKHEGYFDYVQPIKMTMNMPYVAEIQLKTSEAGEMINKADGFMRMERYVEALPILIESFSKNPSPRETAQISYLIGICYLKQSKYKEAQDYFSKALENEDYKYAGRLGLASTAFEQKDSNRALQLLIEILVSSEDPKIRQEAGTLFQKVSPLKSVIYIASDPPGAKVYVNNSDIKGNGTDVAQLTPIILKDLGVGTYRIQLRKDGYEDMEIRVNTGVSEFKPVVVKLKKNR